MAKKVAMIVLDNANMGSVGALLDCVAYANSRQDYALTSDADKSTIDLLVLSLDGAAVPIHGGRRLEVDGSVSDYEAFDFIWIPSFRGRGIEQITTRLEALRPLRQWLRSQADRGAILGASQTSLLVLTDAGLTTGMPVPVYPPLTTTYRRLFPRARIDEASAIVCHGSVMLCASAIHDYALITQALHRLLPMGASNWLKSTLGIAEFEREMNVEPDIEQIRFFLDANSTRDIKIAALCEEFSIAPATLFRRFRAALGMTPRAYVLKQRVIAAQSILESSNRSIESVAMQVGFSDARRFRAAFRKYAGIGASQWRGTRAGPSNG